MHKLLGWVLFLVALAGPAKAQGLAPRSLPPVPDSLKGLMQRSTTPVQRMEALQRVALAYTSRLDSTNALAYARTLEALALQQHSTYYQGEALAIQGQVYFNVKLLPQALRLVLNALPLRTGTRLADSQQQLGQIYSSLNQHSRVLPLLRAAQRTYQAARMHRQRLSIDGDLGMHFERTDQLDSAEFYYLRAARGFLSRPGMHTDASITFSNLSALQYRRGQYAAQARYCRQALAVLRLHPDSTRLGGIFGSLCVAMMYLDSLPRALGYGRQALRLSRRFQKLNFEQSALNNLGACFMKLKQPDSAAVYFRQALALTRRGGSPQSKGHYLQQLAQAAEAANQPAEALRLSLEVAALDSVYRSTTIAIANAGLLAKLAEARHDDAAALAYYKQQRKLERRQAAMASSKNIAALRVQFDTERTEQALALATARAAAEAQHAAVQAQRAETQTQRALALRLLGQQQQATYRVALSQQEQQRLAQQLLAEQQSRRAEQAGQQVAALTQRSQAQAQQVRLQAQAAELSRLRATQRLLGVSALAGLVLLAAGGSFWRYRRRQVAAAVAAQAALRQRLAADLHDDVGNLLTQISLQSGLLRESPLLPAPLLARVDALTSTARRANQQMSDAIWGLSATAPTLPALLAHMRDHAYEVLYPLGVEVRFDTHPAVPALALSVEARQALYLIFKEALHNVVKHARATEVLVQLAPAGSALGLTVRNDGPPAATARAEGQGLANMQARAAAVGGTVTYPAQPAGFVVAAVLGG